MVLDDHCEESTEPIVTRISGPIVTAVGMKWAQMYEVVQVGDLGLVGEVVRLVGITPPFKCTRIPPC